jgi:hypothetical protein
VRLKGIMEKVKDDEERKKRNEMKKRKEWRDAPR